MNIEENKAIVRGFIEEALNGGNVEATGKYFHDDVAELDPFPGQGPGLAGLKDVLRSFFAAFPDMHWTVDEQIGEEDRVMTRITMQATHRGDFMGVASTGRAVSVKAVVIDRLDGQKIKETRILMDMLGMMRQLGAVL